MAILRPTLDDTIAFGGRLRLASRSGITRTQTPNATASARSNVFINPAPTFPLLANQAFRLVAVNGYASDQGNTGFLTLNSLCVFIAAQFTTIARFVPKTYGVGLMSFLGTSIFKSETPLFSNNDYLAAGGNLTPVGVAFSGDVTNSDVAVHPVQLYLAFIVEIYDVKKIP